MKKFLISCLVFISIFALSPLKAQAVTANNISISLNGNAITGDVAPIEKEGRVLVPIRMIAENMGYKVIYFQETQEICLYDIDTSVLMTINQQEVKCHSYVGGNDYMLTTDVPVFVQNNRTYVPIRFITEALHGYVDWDNNTKTVKISKHYEADNTVLLYSEELSAVRAEVIALKFHYEYGMKPLSPFYPNIEHGGSVHLSYYFPIGEALRFLLIDYDIARYCEIRNNRSYVLWQKEYPSEHTDKTHFTRVYNDMQEETGLNLPEEFAYYSYYNYPTRFFVDCGTINSNSEKTSYANKLEGNNLPSIADETRTDCVIK